MRDDVQQLLSLQKIDQTIQSLNKELVKIPQQQEAAKERLANDTAAVAAAKKAYQENEVAIKNVELDIGTRKDTVTKLKNQQFETKKNEEYTRLGSEVTRYEEQIDEFETQELELMEVADQRKSDIATAEEALGKTQALVDEEISGLEARATQFKEQLAEAESQRAQAAEGLEEDLMDTYNRLYDKREGAAVAAVTRERSCKSCHVQVTPATYALAQSGAAISHCDNCGAILYPE
ncbi:hypothetical protein OAF99_02270 [Akkermansiaceae bacterium]|nr:hypothetical protein [Akkermansiaceae bacterium]